MEDVAFQILWNECPPQRPEETQVARDCFVMFMILTEIWTTDAVVFHMLRHEILKIHATGHGWKQERPNQFHQWPAPHAAQAA